MGSAVTCFNCGTEKDVETHSFDLDLPTLDGCSICILALSMDDEQTLAAMRPRRGYREIVDAFGDKIRLGELKAGDRLPSQATLVTQYQVSRNAVRRAIASLAAAGLVTKTETGTVVATSFPEAL